MRSWTTNCVVKPSHMIALMAIRPRTTSHPTTNQRRLKAANVLPVLGKPISGCSISNATAMINTVHIHVIMFRQCLNSVYCGASPCTNFPNKEMAMHSTQAGSGRDAQGGEQVHCHNCVQLPTLHSPRWQPTCLSAVHVYVYKI